jgi:hypothetical protein
MVRITEFDNRFLVFFLKQVYFELRDEAYYGFDQHALNSASKKLGIKTQYMADADYVYALINKNKEHLENGTLSVDNIIIPELRTAMVEHTETHSETVNTTYYIEIETYSEGKRSIIDNYLDNDAEDGIDIYDYEPNRDYVESEFIDSRTVVKMSK